MNYFIFLLIIFLNNIIDINSIENNGIKYKINTNYVLPKIFLLGPMKSGSTSLFLHFLLHNEVCQGIEKEINFLQKRTVDSIDENTRMQYSKKFRVQKCKLNTTMRFVDASPQFHLMSQILPMFPKLYTKKELSELKFIVTLREPVSRTYSYYSHFTREALSNNLPFNEVQSFENRTKGNGNGILIYNTQLELFLKYFRRDQILVLADTYLYTNTVSSMKAISKFLNLKFIEKWSKIYYY
jgi:hypothetical protein